MEIDYNNELAVGQTFAEISDRVISKVYSQCEINKILEKIYEMDLFSMKYSTREQILYTLVDIVELYDVKNVINKEFLYQVQQNCEDDLKEYIAQLI